MLKYALSVLTKRYVREDINPKLMNNVMARIEVPIPKNIEEQTRIATYLDTQTAILDETIALKRRQIDLLREHRTALISHAVTRGLDPTAEMRESGVEWIGMIPKGWEVKKLKYVSSMSYGDALSNENRTEGEIPVYGSNGAVGTHTHSNTLSPALIIGRKGSYGRVAFSKEAVFVIDTAYLIDKRNTRANI